MNEPVKKLEQKESGELDPGFKMTQLGPLPLDWEVAELKDATIKFFGGGTPSTKQSRYWEGPIPWTTTAIIGENDVYLTRYQRGITEEGLRESSAKLAPKDSVLIGTRVGVGKAVVATFDVAINQDITAVLVNNRIVPDFLALALKAPSGQRWFEDHKRGTTIKGVPRGDIMAILVPLPPVSEQKDIVYILNAIKREVEATGKVVDAARELKKSLMRHLFTYGPVPYDQVDNVALKETEIGPMPEHWEIIALDDLVQLKNGVNFSSKQKGKGILTVDVLNMYSDSIYLRADNLYRVDLKLKNEYLLQPNDVLFVRSSLKEEGVGWPALFPGHTEPVTFCGFLIRARLTTSELYPEFLINYLRLPFIRRLLVSKSGKVAITNISQGNLRALPVPLPPLPEQREIALILQAVDRKIEAEENRKRALEALFKTLLHYLMTGKIRVKDLIGSQGINSKL